MQRKHTTTACQICREHKIKCDGIRPMCGSCKRKGKLCEYSSKDDKRKLSLRTAVEMLFGRVEQLTNLANNHNITVPPMSAEEQSLLEQICETLELPTNRVVPSGQQVSNVAPVQTLQSPPMTETLPEVNSYDNNLTMTTIQNDGSLGLPWPTQSTDFDIQNWTDFFTAPTWDGSPSDWPWLILNDFPGLPPYSDENSLPTPQRSIDPQNEGFRSASTSDDDEIEADIVPRLAARFGSLRLGVDGQLRYYGTASNYHFLNGSRHTESRIDLEDVDRAACTALENAQLDEEAPTDLQNHLIELFFTWHNPSHGLVDRDMFETARNSNTLTQRGYCSKSLVNAMCAIGAAFDGRYHQSFITFPKPLADYFAERSKILLEFEYDSPCVSTVQALLLLSSHEAASGKDARMWLYSGMAMRLGFDLGLHIDSGPYVKQGLLNAQEAEARRCTFWGSYVVNTLWSFSLGRPFRVDGEETTVSKPTSMLPTDFNSSWINYPTEPAPKDTFAVARTSKDSISLIASQWVLLCDELAPLIRVLYGCVKITKSALQSLSYKTTTRLETWREEIPDIIKIQSGVTPLPHVLLLHMAYLNFCILVHRPWTSKNSQPDDRIGPGHHHARGVCRKSAAEIASLLRTYESHFGFRKMNVYIINIIFQASLILIFGLIAEEIVGEHHDQAMKGSVAKDLNTCFRALDELGQSFESAKRNHEHLLSIQKHWSQRKRDAKIGSKRRNQMHSSLNRAASKRNRPSRDSGLGTESDVPSLS